MAELELARGDTERARGRLEALVRTAGAPTAFEAATLLATRTTDPRARLTLWEQLLRRSLPGDLRDRAEVARAEALADSGARVEAREVARRLRARGSLSPNLELRLERLER